MIQVDSLAQGSIVGSSHGTKPIPQTLQDPSASAITVMLPICSCYFLRDLLAHSCGVVYLLAAVQSSGPLGTFKIRLEGELQREEVPFMMQALFICIVAFIQS